MDESTDEKSTGDLIRPCAECSQPGCHQCKDERRWLCGIHFDKEKESLAKSLSLHEQDFSQLSKMLPLVAASLLLHSVDSTSDNTTKDVKIASIPKVDNRC